MNYRLATLLARKSYTADAVETIDINLSDPVSQIVITHEATQGANANITAHPANHITKIELIDGSNVLWSLSGAECQAVDWYHNLKEPANQMIYLQTLNTEMIFNINFGRYLWDMMFAFNPKSYVNPQLKISLDIDGGGMNVATNYLTVMAKCFDEKRISPAGFLMCKEVKDYTLANASWEYTDMPRDYPYRKLFIRARRDAVGPEYQIDTVQLHENNKKKVVIDQTMFEILRAITSEKRPYRENILFFGGTSSNTFYCTPAYWPKFAGCGWRNTANIGPLGIYEGDGQRFSRIMDTYAGNSQCQVEGWAPHAVVEIPFGLQDDPADWYDVTKLGALNLDIKGGSSVGTSQKCQILLQQLRR